MDDISVLLKIYGYEYEYAKFSWILFMGSPTQDFQSCTVTIINACAPIQGVFPTRCRRVRIEEADQIIDPGLPVY